MSDFFEEQRASLQIVTGYALDAIGEKFNTPVRREHNETDADYRERLFRAYRDEARALSPSRCVYCGTEMPCVCGSGLR